MQTSRILVLSLVLGLGGCVGLQQFPQVSTSAEVDLATRDADYLHVLTKIAEATGTPEKQKQLRNKEIDKRLRVIDLYFQDFETALADEVDNVVAGFQLDKPKKIEKIRQPNGKWTVIATFPGASEPK